MWWNHFTTVQKSSLRGISTVIKMQLVCLLKHFSHSYQFLLCGRQRSLQQRTSTQQQYNCCWSFSPIVCTVTVDIFYNSQTLSHIHTGQFCCFSPLSTRPLIRQTFYSLNIINVYFCHSDFMNYDQKYCTNYIYRWCNYS